MQAKSRLIKIVTIITCVLLLVASCNKPTNKDAAKKQNMLFPAPKFLEKEKVEIKKGEAEEVINTYFNEIQKDGEACYPQKMVEAMSSIHEGEKFYKYIAENNYGDWFSVEMVMITSISNGKEEIALSYIHLLPENMDIITIQPYLCKNVIDEELLMSLNRYILKIKAEDETIDYEELERKKFEFDKEENCWERTEQLLFIREN